MNTQDAVPKARQWLWPKSLLVGLLCFVVVFLWWNAVLLTLSRQALPAGAPPSAEPGGSLFELVLLVAENALFVTTVECLIFFLPAAALVRLWRSSVAPVLYIGLLGALGWVVHGMGIYNLGRAAAFSILAAWFWHVMSSENLWKAVVQNVIAHGTWNAVIVLGSILRG